MPEGLIEILKIENIFRSATLIFIIPFLVIIAKIVIANLIEQYSEAKHNEIYSKF